MTRCPLMDSNQLDAVHPQISVPTAVLLSSVHTFGPQVLGLIASFGFAAGEFELI